MTKDEVIEYARKTVSTWGTSNHHVAMHDLNMALSDYDEQRMDVIGQNGNNGEHYGDTTS